MQSLVRDQPNRDRHDDARNRHYARSKEPCRRFAGKHLLGSNLCHSHVLSVQRACVAKLSKHSGTNAPEAPPHQLEKALSRCRQATALEAKRCEEAVRLRFFRLFEYFSRMVEYETN